MSKTLREIHDKRDQLLDALEQVRKQEAFILELFDELKKECPHEHTVCRSEQNVFYCTDCTAIIS